MVTATRASHTPAESHLLGDTRTFLTLRVRGSEHDGHVLRIRSPKCVIGSDPGCTLRLDADGVRAVHCLVLRAAEGTFVRRWAAGTRLNGHGFEIARVRPGDCLTVGTVELEFLAPTPCGDPDHSIPPPDPLPATAGTIDLCEPRYRALEGSLQEAQQARQQLEELVEQQRRELAAALEGVKSGQTHIAQLRAELSQRAASPPAPLPEDSAARPRLPSELAEAKDLVLCLRDEMQKQAREHQRARDKWEIDRQALERKVAECAGAAVELQRYYDQYMEEAEVLMHAMQQEGQNMLRELEEARQQPPESGLDGRKTSSLAQTVRSMFGYGAAPNARPPEGADAAVVEPDADPPAGARRVGSACPTLVMTAPWASDASPADEPSDGAGGAPATPDPTRAPSALRAEDDAPARPSATDADLAALGAESSARPPLSTADLPQASPAAEGDQEDDDQAIERYMERLLRRVAKIPDNVETPPQMVAALQARVTAPRPDLTRRLPQTARPSPSATTGDHPPTAAGPAGASSDAPSDSATAHADGVINRILRPREPMPQLAADLLAMRELANHTARCAMDRHAYRHGIVAVAGQCAVAMVCLLSGGALAALSRDLVSAPMIGGALGFSFGMILLMRCWTNFQRLRTALAQSELEA